jgi:DNA-binding transcriptional LysR family regulator
MLVGAPSLLSTTTPPMRTADLDAYPTLDTPCHDSRHVFRLIAPDGTRHDYDHEPRLVTADLTMIREAALAGTGIAALPKMMYFEAMTSGRLSPVMPGWTLPRPQLYAVFLSRQGMMPAVRSFVDFLVEMLDSDTATPPELASRWQAGPAGEHIARTAQQSALGTPAVERDNATVSPSLVEY